MLRKTLIGTFAVVFTIGSVPPDRHAGNDSLTGFRSSRVAAFRALEKKFASKITAEGPQTWMRRLAARPHHVGSEYGKENVEFIRDLFTSWGYDARIDTYHVLFPTPKERVLELVSPTKFTASLEEPRLAEDPSTAFLDDALPTYNAYSADGDVTAELVYVNQGVPKDYEDLERMGIDVKGKIVLARYYGSWRGIKPKLAAEHGAIGCILYSDPIDDGYVVGDAYPEGPMRGEGGAQRGSVMDIPVQTGDPSTPNSVSTEDAERVLGDDADLLMKIPVLPISYADALPLLEAIGGPLAPARWRGGLPATYHVGPGPAVVHLRLAFDWSIRPAMNVIATLRGKTYPDEWVMRGNHHDGWVFGARDPISGLISLLEEARVIGELRAAGWQPQRTIVYAAWDAEEPGLIGSSEWVEDHEAELQKKLVAYINTDSNSRGFLSAGGSHGFERFVAELADDVTDPQTGVSVARRALANMKASKPENDTLTALPLDPLGSGSDYTPFLQHSGIASVNLGFGGEAEWGAYHSVYDTYTHFERFGDPDYVYTRTLAEVAGRMTLRLSESDVIPFRYRPMADEFQSYVDEIESLADDMRAATNRQNDLVRDSAYFLAADPKKMFVPPAAKPAVPHLNFAPLENSVSRLTAAADAYDAGIGAWLETADASSVKALNDLLRTAEQTLLLEDGLPRRPWFKHSIYAPGFYTGYGVKTIPGVREAVEQRSWSEAEAQVLEVAAALDRMSERIHKAIEIISK